MIINFCSARCGAGKTVWAIDTLASRSTRWLYVVDRRDVIPDRIAKIKAAALRHDTDPYIRAIHTARYDNDPMGSLTVRRDIERHPHEHPQDHQVLIITSEALKTIDTSNYYGWSIIIDEVPTIWHSEAVATPALRHQLASTYNLVETDTATWRKITKRPGAVTAADIARDDTMRDWQAFDRAVVSRHGAYTSLTAWEESVADRWRWWTMWSPLELRPFAARYMVANAIEHSTTYHLIGAHWPEVVWRAFDIGAGQVWQPRRLTIRYFASRHLAGSGFWGSEAGAQCLAGWAGWIAANTRPDDHMWATNRAHISSPAMQRIGGQRVSTKIAGSNDYRHITTASIAYSAKPDKSEISLFRAFGITAADITRAREYEDLIQVLFRTSLRDPHDTRDVEWNVYDIRQAEFLRDYLRDNGFLIDVELHHEDIGIDIPAASRSVLKSLRTEEEREAAIVRAREDDAARKRRKRAEARALAGPPKPSGRPKNPERQAMLAERDARRAARKAEAARTASAIKSFEDLIDK